MLHFDLCKLARQLMTKAVLYELNDFRYCVLLGHKAVASSNKVHSPVECAPHHMLGVFGPCDVLPQRLLPVFQVLPIGKAQAAHRTGQGLYGDLVLCNALVHGAELRRTASLSACHWCDIFSASKSSQAQPRPDLSTLVTGRLSVWLTLLARLGAGACTVSPCVSASSAPT